MVHKDGLDSALRHIVPIAFLADEVVEPAHPQAEATPVGLNVTASKASQQLLSVMLGKADLIVWLSCQSAQ